MSLNGRVRKMYEAKRANAKAPLKIIMSQMSGEEIYALMDFFSAFYRGDPASEDSDKALEKFFSMGGIKAVKRSSALTTEVERQRQQKICERLANGEAWREMIKGHGEL